MMDTTRRGFFGLVAGVVGVGTQQQGKSQQPDEGSYLIGCVIEGRGDGEPPMFHFHEDGRATIKLRNYSIRPIESIDRWGG